MKLTLKDIEEKICSAAAKFVPLEEAEYFAKLYLETHLRKTPRMNPINEALNDLKAWEKRVGEVDYTEKRAFVKAWDIHKRF